MTQQKKDVFKSAEKQALSAAEKTPNKKDKNTITKIAQAFKHASTKVKMAPVRGVSALFLFLKHFVDKIRGIEEEEEDVSEETEIAVAKGAKKTLVDAQKTFEFSEEANDGDKKTLNTFLAYSVTNFKILKTKHQKYGLKGLKKLKKKAEGKNTKALTWKEAAPVTAVGLLTLMDYKEKFPDEGDLANELEKIITISDKTKSPLSLLLQTTTLSLYKISNPLGALPFLKKLGIKDIDETRK